MFEIVPYNDGWQIIQDGVVLCTTQSKAQAESLVAKLTRRETLPNQKTRVMDFKNTKKPNA